MKLQISGADHLYSVEPLSVQAFTNAVARAERGALVLDIGSNAGAYSIYAAVLGASVIAVDMQPKCAHLTACHLSINGLTGTVQLAYVASSEGQKYECTTMNAIRCQARLQLRVDGPMGKT